MPDTVAGNGHTSRVVDGPVKMFLVPLPEDVYETIAKLVHGK
jgi:hypothetical protein